MVDGGIPKALKCLQVFLPEVEWKPLDTRSTSIFERTPDAELPATLLPLECLMGYTFKKKALLMEAMTHASSKSGSQSLERLEFLGDAVLDYVVVTAMYPHGLSHVEMHHLKTSLVNADFLAYICLEWNIEQEDFDLEPEPSALDNDGQPKFKERVKKVALPLWRFLRHASTRLGTVQRATYGRHAELKGLIIEAFERGTHYPWALLARLKAPKFFSDMVESLLGAIWVDSGSFETCTEVVERMGILPYFRRILKDGVDTLHPKEALGMLADTESVRYVISSRSRERDDEREYLCTVYVGDVQVVEIDGGVSPESVKTEAAEAAVKILEAKKKGLGEINVNKTEFETTEDVEMKD
jgi:dsRNA-specific ribonuclease